MNLRAALRASALMVFALSATVANAQLSSRSSNGGLFGSLVTWVHAGTDMSIVAPELNQRGSPFSASRVQLGTVRAADANEQWMSYRERADRALAEAVSRERALRASAEVYWHNVSRVEAMFESSPSGPPVHTDAPRRELPVDDVASTFTTDPVTTAFHGIPLSAALPLQDVTVGGVDVIVNPEPGTYVMAAIGLLLIVVIRRKSLA